MFKAIWNFLRRLIGGASSPAPAKKSFVEKAFRHQKEPKVYPTDGFIVGQTIEYFRAGNRKKGIVRKVRPHSLEVAETIPVGERVKVRALRTVKPGNVITAA